MADREVTTKYILQGDPSGMVAAADKARNSMTGLVGATQQNEAAFLSMSRSISVAAAAFGTLKISEYIKDSTMMAARVETLGVVMKVVGNNAGYSSKEMATYAQQVAQMGITTETSRQSVIKMASAHMDLNKASELARVAQDAAVIGNINSSEAFDKMIHGIQSAQVDVLRTIGINVNFEDSYKKIAAQLGKNTQELTENEKIQARTNVVLEKGRDIAGSYSASMDTAGKIINSMKRPADEIALSLGQIFTPSLNMLAKDFYNELVGVSKALKDGQPAVDAWGNKTLEVTIAVKAEFMRLAMLVDKVGGSFTTAAARAFTVAGVISRAMTLGQFGQGLESRAAGMKEANALYASRYAATEAELTKLAEKYNAIGVASAGAAENIKKHSAETTGATSAQSKAAEQAAAAAQAEENAYINLYNSLQDKINENNPLLNKEQQEMLKLRIEYDNHIARHPQYRAELEKTYQVELDNLALKQKMVREAKAAAAAIKELEDQNKDLDVLSLAPARFGMAANRVDGGLSVGSRYSKSGRFSLMGAGPNTVQQYAPEQPSNRDIRALDRFSGLQGELGAGNDPYSQQKQALQRYYDERFDIIVAAAEAEGEISAKHNEASLKLYEGYTGAMAEMDRQRVETAVGYMGQQMTQLGQTLMQGSKDQFEVGKGLAIAGAVIDTYRAATGAYAAMASIPYVGPFLGAAAAAAAVVSGMAQVATIESTRFEPRETGGPVQAGRHYLVGERGPELLTMGANSSGFITPNKSLQGKTTNVTVVYQITPGLADTVRSEIMKAVPAITNHTVSAVGRAINSGGSLSAAVGRM